MGTRYLYRIFTGPSFAVCVAGLREKDLDTTQKIRGTVMRKCLSPKNLFYYLAKCLTKNLIFGGARTKTPNFVSRQIK
jgi:hypothetical protein